MTKQTFATNLLFLLTPWPISKALPKSLRIQYFGPSAAPPGSVPGYVPPGSLPPGDAYIPGPWGWIPPRLADPTEAQWEEGTKTNPHFWDTIGGWVWNGYYWEAAFAFGVALWPIGTWMTDFRPTHVRFDIIWSGPGALTFTLYDEDGPPNFIVNNADCDSLVSEQINWAGFDMTRFEFTGTGTLKIRKIQFASP